MKINNFTKILILFPMLSIYGQIEYTIDFNAKTEPIDYGSIKQTEIGFSLFKKVNSGNELTNNFKYKSTTITNEIEEYLIKNYVTNYDNTHFNSITNQLSYSHQLSNSTKLTIDIEPTLNFQNTLSFSDLSILGGIAISHIINKNNHFDIGLKRMTVFGKPEILPTVTYYHQFNETISAKLGFPYSAIIYSNSVRNTFSLNNEFSGDSYNLYPYLISDDFNTISKIGFSQMETSLQYTRNIDSSWFVGFKGGYSTNKEFKFSDENIQKEWNRALKNGGLFSISLKYKH